MTIMNPFINLQLGAQAKKTATIKLQPVATLDDSRWSSDRGKAHSIFEQRKTRIAGHFAAGRRTMPVVRAFLNNPQVRLSAALRALGGNPCRQQAQELLGRVNACDVAPDFYPA